MRVESNNALTNLKSVFWRILHDAYPLRPSRAWIAAALSLLPPLLQIAVFGGLLHVLSTLAQGQPLAFFGTTLLNSAGGSLALLALLATLGLGAAAVSGFLLDRVSEQLSQRYVSFCTARVFSILDRRGFVGLGGSSDLIKRERFNRLLRVDAFNLGRQWHRILGLPLPIAGALLLALGALFIDPLLCAALSPVFLLAVVAQRRLMAQSEALSAQLEHTAPEVNRVQGAAFERLRRDSHADYAQAAPEFERHLDVQRRTFLLQAKSHLITHLATAVALGLLVLTALLAGDFSAERLTRLAMAVVMLRIAAGHLSHLAATLTMIARFQPQTRRYFALVDGRELGAGDGQPDPSEGYE